MKVIDRSVFREYDIRGIWGKNIDAEFSFKLGVAFGRYLKEKLKKSSVRVSVGYDARHSSTAIFDALTDGFDHEGVKVIDIGLVPTPVQYFSLFQLRLDGGVMITASHNPKEYNGFKLSLKTETLFGEKIQQLADIMEKLNLSWHEKKDKDVEKIDIKSMYYDYMEKQFEHLKEHKNKPRFALDGGNGVAGFVGYEIFKRLGFEVESLFIEPDGDFPNHHPDPTVDENLMDLRSVIKSKELEFGIGYDGDGDRIGVVLKDGSPLYGDQLLLLLAQELCGRRKGAKVILDVKCSDVVFELLKKANCKPIMYKTGHSLIKDKMKSEGAPLAGEMSGHIFIADNYFGYDDAIYVSLRLVDIITTKGVDILEWKNSLPPVYNTPEIRIECPEDKKMGVIEEFKKILKKNSRKIGVLEMNTIDGVRFKTDKGFGLVRASNTQPVLVLRFEASSKEHLELLKEFTLKTTEELINKYEQ